MHARQDPPSQLLALAGCQGGVLTTEQVGAFGLGPNTVQRLLRLGIWRRLATGLYFVHDVEPDWSSLAWGGVLLGGDEARLGGRSAGHLWELVDSAPVSIEVLIPHQQIRRDQGCWTFTRERPGVRELGAVGNPPRLRLPDTVLDLSNELEADQAVSLVLRAVQTRRTRPERLVAAIAQRQRLRHRRLMLDVLQDADRGAETMLEVHYLRDVERAHGLPRGRRQSGSGDYVRDVLYDEFSLVVELDGRLGHENMGIFRDMERDNHATVSGERTLRYGWTAVTGHMCRVAGQVSTMLIRQGWSGLPHRCHRCRSSPHQQWGS